MVKAFKWTGTYYNSQYDTSYEVTFSDDDGAYDGQFDTSETVSIDGGPQLATGSRPYKIDVTFTGTDGNDYEESFRFFYADGDWYFIPEVDSNFSEGATLGAYQGHTEGWDYAEVVCFVSGTCILTDRGDRKVEELSRGDRVWTKSGGFKPLLNNLHRSVSPRELSLNAKLAPIRIEPDALGDGMPNETLWVSRQHRMLVSSQISERMFGTSDVLVAAIRLVGLPGISVDTQRSAVTYHHLVFEAHEIVCANRALSESFLPKSQARQSVPGDTVDEFAVLFPNFDVEAETLHAAALIPPNTRQKRLVLRHAKNQQRLVAKGYGGKVPVPVHTSNLVRT